MNAQIMIDSGLLGDCPRVTPRTAYKINRGKKMNAQITNDVMVADPVTCAEKPYPSQADQYREYHGVVAWLYNPWTRNERYPQDIGTDPEGKLIVPPLKQEARITVSGPVQCGKSTMLAAIQRFIEKEFRVTTASTDLDAERRIGDPDAPTKADCRAIAQTLWILTEVNNPR